MADVFPINHGARERHPFLSFARMLVEKQPGILYEEGPEEQAEDVVRAMRRIDKVTPLTPVVNDETVDIPGFGGVYVIFKSTERAYLLLSDICQVIGWPQHKAHAFAERMHEMALADQRRIDEERGDGRFGWEHLLDYVELGVQRTTPDPDATPDVAGKRWTAFGDWFISEKELSWVVSCSPAGHALRELGVQL
ncbi:hypothetical protein [Streptomyces sp. NPDC055107]